MQHEHKYYHATKTVFYAGVPCETVIKSFAGPRMALLFVDEIQREQYAFYAVRDNAGNFVTWGRVA